MLVKPWVYCPTWMWQPLYGKITLEIANLGPFDLCLVEGDAISQIVVATISSPPTKRKQQGGIAIGQRQVSGNQ